MFWEWIGYLFYNARSVSQHLRQPMEEACWSRAKDILQFYLNYDGIQRIVGMAEVAAQPGLELFG